jgi:hypothetical protein
LLILTRIGKKSFKYFSQFLAQKKVTNMLKEILRTQRKNLEVFVKKFELVMVQIAKNSKKHTA